MAYPQIPADLKQLKFNESTASEKKKQASGSFNGIVFLWPFKRHL
jgi:hypothetical protein